MSFLKVSEKLFLSIRRVPFFANPEGSYFCESGRVLFLPIRRRPIFQSGGVQFSPIQKGAIFVNPEGSYFCQSGGVLFLSIRRGPVFTNLNPDIRDTKSKLNKNLSLICVD